MRNILIIALSFLLSSNIIAQKAGHKITIDFPEMANKEMLLAYHYGSKQYLTDTIVLDNKGKGALTGEEPMHHGVYLAVFPSLDNNYFEFIVKDQFFGIEIAEVSAMKHPKFINSKDNTTFYADMKKMADIRAASQILDGKIKAESDATKKEALKKELETINSDFTIYRENLMAENPDLFYTDLLGIMREIKIPDAPLNEKGEPDTDFQFQYFRKHYWDYVDFSEEGIVRTPIFKGKFMDYFDKYTYKVQDSLIVSCDIVLEKAKANDNVFQFTLVELVNKYANSKVMGDQSVYVHLVKNYYEKNMAWWVDEAQIAKMKDRRMALEPLLIGKISPDITLRDTTTRMMYRLHDLPSEYTIVYIWDPECGHCKKSTPKLSEFYKKHLADQMIMVYAITTSNIEELDKWKAFIKKHNLNWINVGDLYHQTNFRKIYDVASTPQVFVLDENKEIIAKRIGVEQLEGFFHQMLKNKGDERYKNFILDDKPLELEEEHNEGDGHGH